MKTTDQPITVEQVFKVSVEKLWHVLTNKEEMNQWFFEQMEAFEPKVGFKTQFNVQSEDRNFMHLWTIKEVIPKKRITQNWKYEEYEGESDVIFDLSTHNGGSKLKVTTKILKDFPDGIPEFKRESCLGGWNYFIKQRLKEYID